MEFSIALISLALTLILLSWIIRTSTATDKKLANDKLKLENDEIIMRLLGKIAEKHGVTENEITEIVQKARKKK